MALCAEMLCSPASAADADAARTRLQDALDSGAAAERFADMVRALGGPAKFVDQPWTFMERAPVIVDVVADRARHRPRRSTLVASVSPSSPSAAAAPGRRTRSTTPSGSPGWLPSAIAWRRATCSPPSTPAPPTGPR